MDIEQAKSVLSRTHMGAIRRGERATTYMLVGKSGTAKSEGVRQQAAEMARLLNEPFGLVTKMAASWSSVDFGGFMIPKNIKGYDWPLSLFTAPPWLPNRFNCVVFDGDEIIEPPLPEEYPIPEYGWLFLDEWGLLEDDLQKAGAPLLLDGRIGDHRLPVHWRVVAASNRLQDKTGVAKALTLVQNRMGTLAVQASYPTWERWTAGLPAAQRPHHLTISFANKNPHIVFGDEAPPGNNEPFCTSRSLVKMDKDLCALRSDEEIDRNAIPVDGVAKQVAAGLIGGGASSQYFTHVKYAEKTPTYQQVVRNPREAKLPVEPDAQMVTAFAIAHQLADEDHVDRVMEYINRMAVDMQVLFQRQVRGHAEKGPWLTVSRATAQWTAKHGDLLLASHG